MHMASVYAAYQFMHTESSCLTQTWACATVPISGNAHKNVVEMLLNVYLGFVIVFSYMHSAGLPARHSYERICVVFGCVQPSETATGFSTISSEQGRQERRRNRGIKIHDGSKSQVLCHQSKKKKKAFLSLIWGPGSEPHSLFLPLFYQFPTLTLFLSTHIYTVKQEQRFKPILFIFLTFFPGTGFTHTPTSCFQAGTYSLRSQPVLPLCWALPGCLLLCLSVNHTLPCCESQQAHCWHRFSRFLYWIITWKGFTKPKLPFCKDLVFTGCCSKSWTSSHGPTEKNTKPFSPALWQPELLLLSTGQTPTAQDHPPANLDKAPSDTLCSLSTWKETWLLEWKREIHPSTGKPFIGNLQKHPKWNFNPSLQILMSLIVTTDLITEAMQADENFLRINIIEHGKTLTVWY